MRSLAHPLRMRLLEVIASEGRRRPRGAPRCKDLTGSKGAAGLVFLAVGLPILISPLLGHLVDRGRRQPLLIAVNAGAAVGVLVLLRVEDVGQLWVLYVVAGG